MKPSTDKTIIDYLFHWETASAEKVFLRQPINGVWYDTTWKETGSQVRKIAKYLQNLNLPPKSNIGLVSKNCAEWIIADMAIIASGHVSVPLYPTLTGEQINSILDHAECDVVFFGKLDGWKDIKKGIARKVKGISFPNYNPDSEHIHWNDILQNTDELTGTPKFDLNEVYTIIYTSGTTGNPKGVMLNHKALADCITITQNVSKVNESGNTFFSYLPLSHIAERNIVESVGVVSGGTIYFAENLDTFAQNLAFASPTHFLAVPRIWSKFQLGILAKLPQKKLDLLLKIPIINSIIKYKIKKGLGLHQTRLVLTGAAPMPTSLILWFRKLGIIIQEAYGMTENLGAVCVMPAENIKDGYVGKINNGMEVKLAPQTGEILTRSTWNMVGYYKEPKMTSDTIDAEGWLHTGDVGEIDADNYLKITGRVKEMYKTSKGEYVAPAQIEMAMSVNSVIEQVCVVGESLPQPIALVVVSEIGKKMDKASLKQNLSEQLTNLNPILKNYERIKKIVLLKDSWTVENNKLTPTMKIKRNIIEKEFENRYEMWYEHADEIIEE